MIVNNMLLNWDIPPEGWATLRIKYIPTSLIKNYFDTTEGWAVRHDFLGTTIYFEKEEDATMFKLRFSIC